MLLLLELGSPLSSCLLQPSCYFPFLISIVVAPSGMLERVFLQRLIKSRTLESAIARLLFRSD